MHSEFQQKRSLIRVEIFVKFSAKSKKKNSALFQKIFPANFFTCKDFGAKKSFQKSFEKKLRFEGSGVLKVGQTTPDRQTILLLGFGRTKSSSQLSRFNLTRKLSLLSRYKVVLITLPFDEKTLFTFSIQSWTYHASIWRENFYTDVIWLKRWCHYNLQQIWVPFAIFNGNLFAI